MAQLYKEKYSNPDMTEKKASILQHRMDEAEEWVNYFQSEDEKFQQMGQFRANLENGVALMRVAIQVDSQIGKLLFKQKDIKKPNTKFQAFNRARIGQFDRFCKEYGGTD
eukprot:870744_1